MTQPLIEFENVKKSFGDKTVLNGVSLKIYEGQVTTIIGKSGTGKSVMLKHIIGMMQADSGNIYFKGKDIAKMNDSERTEYTGQLSYMFQNNALFDSMTVYENIAFPLEQTTDLSLQEIQEKVLEKMRQTDLGDVGDKFPSELSGGMQKRVALSRALVTEPMIVLFDEPTTGQDIVRRNAILSMVAEYQKKFGFTAIIISHDIPDILFISNRVLVLHEGKIVFQGSPMELEDFNHTFIDEFIHSLEGFQEHLTGLYSKRSFKMRYQNSLNKKEPDETYVVLIFSIAGFGPLCDQVGYITAQELVKELGEHISKQFDVVGGFSARQRRSRFITVLPFSDLGEARQLLEQFADEIKTNGFYCISDRKDLYGQRFDIKVMAGFAEGEADSDDMNSVLVKARKNLYSIAKVQCAIKE